MIKKEHLEKEDNKRKKEKHDNHIGYNKRERMKKRTAKEKKRDNLHDNEKVQLRKFEKKERKLCAIALGMMRKKNSEKNDKRKMDKRLQTLDKRSSVCNNVQMCSMTDPCLLTTPAFRLIEDFKITIEKCPTNICDIYDITQIHNLKTIISVSKFQ